MEEISGGNENKIWTDEEDKEIKISLNKKNHLKKLKKNREEDFVTGEEFQQRLREQYNKMISNSDLYKWAENEESEDTAEDDLDKLLRTNKNIASEDYLSEKETNVIKIKQIPDLNKGASHTSIVTSISFHPSKENLAMTSGLDKKLKLFSINDNDLKATTVQAINTIDMPIFSAKYLNTQEVVISGRRKHYFIYDMEKNKLEKINGNCANTNNHMSSLEKVFVGNNLYAFGGDEGYIFIYDSLSKRFRYDIKIPGTVNSVCFDRNDMNLYAVGDQSEIYLFDLRKYRNCLKKINDIGNFSTNFMDLSNDNNFLATGSKSGIVNLFSIEDILNSTNDAQIEPVKSIENLTTSCEFLKFSRTSNKLGMCSRWKKHALKLVMT